MHPFHLPFHIPIWNVIVPIEIDLAQEEYVFAAHEEDSAGDVGVETCCTRGWGNKDPLGGGLEDEVCCGGGR
jgi:hypothetical protein